MLCCMQKKTFVAIESHISLFGIHTGLYLTSMDGKKLNMKNQTGAPFGMRAGDSLGLRVT